MVDLSLRVLVMLGYTAVALTGYFYLARWLFDMPESLAAAVTTRPRFRGLVTVFGNMAFFFLMLLALMLYAIGLALLGRWLLPSP